MNEHYILDGHKVVETDVLTWTKTFERGDRNHVVARTKMIDDSEVSTVFLGFNYQYGDGPPLLFETMVFGGPLDQEMERCTTWEQAEAMHKAMCERVYMRIALRDPAEG